MGEAKRKKKLNAKSIVDPRWTIISLQDRDLYLVLPNNIFNRSIARLMGRKV